MSWWKAGSPVPGTNTSTKTGLYGGFISQVDLLLNLTEEMNGEEYTCQAKNPEITRTVHDTTALNILCEFFSAFKKFILSNIPFFLFFRQYLNKLKVQSNIGLTKA